MEARKTLCHILFRPSKEIVEASPPQTTIPPRPSPTPQPHRFRVALISTPLIIDCRGVTEWSLMLVHVCVTECQRESSISIKTQKVVRYGFKVIELINELINIIH